MMNPLSHIKDISYTPYRRNINGSKWSCNQGNLKVSWIWIFDFEIHEKREKIVHFIEEGKKGYK